MSPQHPVFSSFQAFRGEVPPYYAVDFLGTKIRAQFVAGITASSAHEVVQTYSPEFDEEYFEWIDLLESVVGASGSYTMIELGAGFGRWAVRAAVAVQQYHRTLPYRIVAVEAEPVVFSWMHQHFHDNGIDPNQHSLIHGAVTESSEEAQFYIGAPRGGPQDLGLNEWYGQCLIEQHHRNGESMEDGEYAGFKVTRFADGWRSIRVPGVSLAGIIKGFDRIDLIDMDIEGQELPVVRSTIQELDAKLKRLHIGTHSKEIEAELRQILSAHGWHCQADYPLFSACETPWGVINFQNGVQSWVNSKLA
jgi:FkbM family methyltransferase